MVSDDGRAGYGTTGVGGEATGVGLIGVAGNDFLLGAPAFTIAMSSSRGASPCASNPRENMGTSSRSDGHRSSGFFSSIRMTAPESSSDSSDRLSRIGIGVSCMCAICSSIGVPVNGGAPVSSSYARIPSEY